MPIYLPTAEQQFLASIVTYGQSINAGANIMQTVRDIAFQESSLNTNSVTQPTTQAQGPFQYTPGVWSDWHSDLNITSPTDQIVAAFQDVQKIDNMYIQLSVANPQVYDNYSLSDYAYAIWLNSLGTNTQPTALQLQHAHTLMSKVFSELGNLVVHTRAAFEELNSAGEGAGIAYSNLGSGGFTGFTSYITGGATIDTGDITYDDLHGNSYLLQGTQYQAQE